MENRIGQTVKPERVICVILAGGQSRRMGRDKAALPLGKGTFLTRLIETYRPAFPVYVSVGSPGRFPHPGAEELLDLRPGLGPLAGLEAAFARTGADAVFLTATDLPFGTLALAEMLLDRLGPAEACVIRRQDGGIEPAFGIYRQSCYPVIRELLDGNRRAMRGLLDRVQVRWVEESELPDCDLDRLLMNVNTPEAYAAVLEDPL